MKKKLLTVLATGMFVMGAVGMAQALTLGDVVFLDEFIEPSAVVLPNNPENETQWVFETFGLDYRSATFWKDSNGMDNWVPVDNTSYIAYLFPDFSPLHFLIKTGQGADGDSHFFYENLDKLEYAVIDPSIWGGSDVSHISSWVPPGNGNGTPVPEPASMLLLGVGLAGIYGIGRRRIKAA